MNTIFDQRTNNFDCMRMFFALLVIFSHSYPLTTGTEIREPFVLLTRGQATGGSIAVDSFFIISGFLIAASFERSKNLFIYFKKRIFRIYPAFIVTSFICAVCVLPLSGGAFGKQSILSISLDFLVQTVRLGMFHFVHAFTGNPVPEAINGSIWTIFYEFVCYIGVALLGITGILKLSRILLAIFAALILFNFACIVHPSIIEGLHRGFHFIPVTRYFDFVRFAVVFTSGVAFYRFRGRIPLRTAWMVCAFFLLMLAARIPNLWAVIFPIAGAYLIITFAFHPKIQFHGFGRYGDFSYGTYLYAYPIQQLIVRWGGHPISPLLLFALAVPPTLFAAVCSWHGVERWFLQQSHAQAFDRPQSSVLEKMA